MFKTIDAATVGRAAIALVALLLPVILQELAGGQWGAAVAAQRTRLHTWTNHQGVTIEGEFLELVDGLVRLQARDGTTFAIPINTLIRDDQEYVQWQLVRRSKPGEEHGLKGAPPAYRVWTDSTGQHQTEGKLLDFEDGKVTLKKKDGSIVVVPVERLNDADRDFLRQWATPRPEIPAASVVPAPKTSQGPSNVVELDFGSRRAPAAGLPQLKEVVVTGVGTDPDKAVQNAFSQVIEQTVGVLVDAETVVKNDQLIRDEVLTYSRGYVEKYEVVKRWQEDGLHHATIQALVARDKLAAKLKSIKISVQEVAGDLAARQIDVDAKNEEQAAEMFEKALAGFDMTKLTKVEIVGKPEITREGVNAKVQIKARVSPELGQWNKFSQDLRSILTRTAISRAVVTMQHKKTDDGWKGSIHLPSRAVDQLRNQLKTDGVLVGLFGNVSISGDKTQWEIFRAPEPMGGVIEATAAGKHYRLTYLLLDEQGEQITRTALPLRENGFGGVIRRFSEYPLGETWWIGPTWNRWGSFISVFEVETTVTLSQDNLSKVTKAAVFLEEDQERRHR